MLCIPREVDDEIRSANRGRRPRTKSEFIRAAAHFDCAVVFYDLKLGQGKACMERGVIFVPDIDKDHPVNQCHIHELAEACLQWEGRPMEIVRSVRLASRHEVARCVDLLQPRPGLTQERREAIDRAVKRLENVVRATGFDELRVKVGKTGITWGLEYADGEDS